MQNQEEFSANSALESDYSIIFEELETEREEDEYLLLGQLSRSDSNAFWKLWERHQNYFYSLCLRWSKGNRMEAEDALSRAAIKAWHELPEYAEKIMNFKAWLTRLIYNLCIDTQREYKRRARSIENIEESLEANNETVLHVLESPEETLLRREMYAYIRYAIDDLPPRLREPLILRFFQEMSYSEISKQLTLSTENVRKRIQQARALLKERLHDYLLGLDGPALDKPWPNEPAMANSEESMAVEYILNREVEEIKFKVIATCVVQIVLPSGVEVSVYLILDRKPTRQYSMVDMLRRYVQQHPRGWKKRLELAHLLYIMGQWEEAIHEYRQVLEKQSQLIDVWLQLGKILHQMEREEEAIAVYERALLLARKVATQHHVDGLIEVCRWRYEMAAKAFEEAASLEPHNAAHWHALGLTHLRIDCPNAALQAFDEALKIDPRDTVALIRSHDALCALGRLREAQRRVILALRLAPDNVLAIKRVADHRTRMGLVRGEEGKKTYQLIRQALRLAPDAADIHESFALYHILRGEWENGKAVLQTFTERHLDCPRCWYHYAWWLFYTGDTQTAADAIMKVYALYRNDAEIYHAMCEILPCAGRLDELRSLVEEMLQRFPERWTVWTTAGLVLVKWFKNENRAWIVSAQAPQLQPHLADAWFQHGRVLAMIGRNEEAVVALEQGWKCLPEEECNDQLVQIAWWLGESYQALGEEQKSLAWWEEAVSRALEFTALNPAIAYYWQGKALEALGDVPRMMQVYKMALSVHLLYPARREVKETLERLHTFAQSEFLF
jgi:RNA polymerase sigma factor (sigma-70 family)